MIERQFTADRINEICNHPAVRDWVRLPTTEYVDLTRVVANPANVILLDDGGGVIFQRIAHRVFEGHLQFLPGYRGAYALHVLRACADWMFTHTDAEVLVGRTPEDNRAALRMNRLLGMRFIRIIPDAWPTRHGLVAMHEYHLRRDCWATPRD